MRNLILLALVLFVLVLFVVGSVVIDEHQLPSFDSEPASVASVDTAPTADVPVAYNSSGEPRAASQVECARRVERLANYSFRWTGGWTGIWTRFPRYRWDDDERRIATMFGDSIEFQNGFGAWQRHRYSCRVDGTVEPPSVLDVTAVPGRLP